MWLVRHRGCGDRLAAIASRCRVLLNELLLVRLDVLGCEFHLFEILGDALAPLLRVFVSLCDKLHLRHLRNAWLRRARVWCQRRWCCVTCLWFLACGYSGLHGDDFFGLVVTGGVRDRLRESSIVGRSRSLVVYLHGLCWLLRCDSCCEVASIRLSWLSLIVIWRHL